MSTASVKKPRRRPGERRQQVLDGTIQVLIEDGVEGLSHRRVAKAAGVPLSATTHYYATRDDLLEAAFVEVITGVIGNFRKWFEALPEDADLIAMLAQHVADSVEKRDEVILLVELWVAAIRRETLRARFADWNEAWAEVLQSRMDPVGARVMSKMLGGLAQQSLCLSPLSVDEIEVQLRRSYEGP